MQQQLIRYLNCFSFCCYWRHRIFPSIFLFLLFAALAITLSFDCLFYCCFFSPEKKKYWRLFSFCETENEWSFKFLLFVLIPFLISLLSRLIFFFLCLRIHYADHLYFYLRTCVVKTTRATFHPNSLFSPLKHSIVLSWLPRQQGSFFPLLLKYWFPFPRQETCNPVHTETKHEVD